MTITATSISDYLIPDKKLSEFLGALRHQLQESKNPDASSIGWSTPTLEEINPNVIRSLSKKYRACEDNGFKAAKIAGLYAFWIAKLKPVFSPFNAFRCLNEYAALNVGIGYINERINIEITLDNEEVLDLCDTLRYHTSSPHALMHLFTLLIEREKLKHRVSMAEGKLKQYEIK